MAKTDNLLIVVMGVCWIMWMTIAGHERDRVKHPERRYGASAWVAK